jgi:GR25 family glycosyltransferase involved in LPS biosynthesis
MENQIKHFVQNPSEQNGYILLQLLNSMNANCTAVLIGQFLSKLYPESLIIRSATAVSAFYSKQYRLSYELCSKNLEYSNITDSEIDYLTKNRKFSSKHITNDFIHYNKKLVDVLMSKPSNPIPIITFTITTCKRLDLFEKTINSFLNCCKDLNRIDKWLCVDDNSSEKDREVMKTKYPFFTFYWKNMSEKGHICSMNIIKQSVRTEFIFHMEDDWKFFHRRAYISDCMKVLLSDKMIGQCLINKNYGETLDCCNIIGGFPEKTKSGMSYVTHEYTPDDASKKEFAEKYKFGRNCAYWPHFSFRPSLLKRDVLESIGLYSTVSPHFEMDYAYRYVNAGFKSCFLDGIFCLHTGRLTSQRDDKNIFNAYDLNGENQFCKKELEKQTIKFTISTNVKTVLINMDSRPDRLKTFDEKCPVNYERFSAVTGKLLEPNTQLQRIFEGNDYNMRTGIVGVALSQIKLYIDLIQSNRNENIYCIFEDDVSFGPNFRKQIYHLMNNLPEKWDLIYLGHHLFPQHRTPDCYNTEILPTLQKDDISSKSMGGAFAYLITKEGALKLMEFINKTGMTNAIDTMHIKADMNHEIDVYYSYPHIVFSECVLPGNNINSDIQYDFTSLNLPNYKDDGKYPDRLKKNGVFDITDALVYKNDLSNYFKFFPDVDQIGNDIYVNKESVELNMRKALNDKNCMGFNTLGFFKNKIENLTPSQYFSKGDGIYIKIRNM